MNSSVAQSMYELAQTLFPICRSITGNGVRETLALLKEQIPSLEVNEVPSGTKCFDWSVPREWNIEDAFVLDPDGKKVIDFKESNLSVVNYSIPTDCTLTLDELNAHLHSLPELPDAIPYVASYYKERWGFCLTENRRKKLKPGNYRAVIKSELKNGSLTYGEVFLPGESKEEVFLSTYICHPSMANNELSGPVVTTYLAKWLSELPKRKYSYRIVFIPETIGSIVYLSRNWEHLKKHVIAGFNVTCVGDDRTYSYLPSRQGNTYSDQLAQHVLKHLTPSFTKYSFLDRGSDERQYCSPGIDLPMVSVMRSKYGTYPEYHSSLDNLSLISPTGLEGGYEAIRSCLEVIEKNRTLATTVKCEPQLGPRGLYPTLSGKKAEVWLQTMKNLLAYSDGTLDLLSIADIIGRPVWELFEVSDKLASHGLLRSVEAPKK